MSLDQAGRAVAALLMAGAGIVHAGFVFPHAGAHPLYALFFAGAAVFQLAGAAVVLRSRSRTAALDLVSDGNAALVILWVTTRVAGPALFPGTAWIEPIGYADALCTLFEAAAVVLLAASARANRSAPGTRAQRVPLPAAVSVLAALTVAMAALTGPALAGAGAHRGHEVCEAQACAAPGHGPGGPGH